MSRDHLRRRVLAGAVVPVLGAGLLSACTSDSPPPEKQAAQRFLSAVGRADVAAASALTTSASAARTSLQASLTGLGAGAKGAFSATDVHTEGSTSTVDFTARWTLPGTDARWTYDGSVRLARSGSDWRVQWTPADLHPGLTTGSHLLARRVQPTRAALQDSSGKDLFAATPVVTVGIEPAMVENLTSLARTLAAIPQLQSTQAEIIASVKAAPSPTAFVPVITLRRTIYDQIRATVRPLAGTVFQESTRLLPPSTGFGAQLLGRVGDATAELVARSGGRLASGDQTGIGGLQQAFDKTLAGTAGVDVVTADDATGLAGRTLSTVAKAVPGTAVKLTIDRRTQQAAETALAKSTQGAAIVAVQRSTGRIVADANTSAATFDYGLAGAFPPGSTFKIATWTAEFTARPTVTPATKVACPATVTVDGRRFENENRFSYPPIPISSAFGYSCNTSAITAAMALSRNAVADAARTLGLGATWSLPVTAFSGSVAAPASQTEQAADAIGQGRVLASPLLMALMADAATTGAVLAPSLEAGKPVTVTGRVPSTITAKMTTLMKATVDLPGGTGHELADLSGVQGKTGTAEYGDATPPRSHAWFAGVQGDLAFAVFVYDGASQKVDPSALVHRFLTGVA